MFLQSAFLLLTLLLSASTQGVGCARPGVPGVYSRISGAGEWIKNKICQLSENPPSTCGSGSRTNFVRVDMYYDENPTDTSWSIISSSGVTIKTSDLVADENILVSTFIDIDEGGYRFEINDSFGDGLDGNGKFEVYMNGIELLLSGGGDIGYGTTIPFTVGRDVGALTTAPSLVPSQPVLTPTPTEEQIPGNLTDSSPNSTETTASFGESMSQEQSVIPSMLPSSFPSSMPTDTASPSSTPSKLSSSTIVPTVPSRSSSPTSVAPSVAPSAFTFGPSGFPSDSPSTVPSLAPSKGSSESVVVPVVTPAPSTVLSDSDITPAPTLASGRGSLESVIVSDSELSDGVTMRVQITILATPEEVSLLIEDINGNTIANFNAGSYKETGSIEHLMTVFPGQHIVEFANWSGEGQGMSFDLYRNHVISHWNGC